MIRVYDFRDQHEKIAAMQRTSLTGDDGLEPQPLVASDDWWKQIAAGAMPAVRLDGTITRVYWASMADWPEFEIRDAGGEISSWTRWGDVRRFVEGLSVSVEYVEHPWKPSSVGLGTHSRIVLAQSVEQSLVRAAAIAPGPGGVGYEFAREHGEATHYLCAPTRDVGAKMLSSLESQGRIAAFGWRDGVQLDRADLDRGRSRGEIASSAARRLRPPVRRPLRRRRDRRRRGLGPCLTAMRGCRPA
jgi:hypothetical protein